MISIPSDLNDASVNEAADYYYSKWGVNYLPANTKDKSTTIKWKVFQEAPLLEDQHRIWTDNDNEEIKGIALVMGKFWNNPFMEGKFLSCIDFDNKAAIDIWRTRNGNKSLEELAQSYPIEQHTDDMNRAHIYIITTDSPLTNKAANRDKDPNVPAIEVMGKGKYVCCTPSTHKNGYKYRFVYGLKPIEEYESFNASKIENIVNDICVEYGIPYLDKNKGKNGNTNGDTKNNFGNSEQQDQKWYEGERHGKLLTKANSLMIKHLGALHIDDIKELIYAKNKKHCVPPLPDWEVEQICKDTENYAEAVKSKEDKTKDESEKEKQTKAQVALETATQSIKKLFIDQYQIPHAAILVNEHLEVLSLDTKRFRNYLAGEIYKQNNTVLDPQTLKAAISVLSAKATFDSGEPINLNLRVAQIPGTNALGKDDPIWYYDLTNQNWEFIKITSNGWNVAKDEIIFRRYNNQQAQVYPDRNYEPDIFDRFFKLVNIKADDKDGILLLKCYIISLFIPEIQKVVLNVYGSKGAAKSSLQELIKKLVDPSIPLTLTFPRDLNELIQQLSHNYITYYDNISTLSKGISDQLCRAVSGSGSSKRQLFTDDDDIIRSFKRCIGINGINLAATKADLLDRSILIKLEEIEDSKRRTPEEIWKEFEELRAQLLGYIFDILVKVLEYEENNPGKKFKMYRMTEFSKYGEIIASCLGYPDDEFINAYERNREIESDEIIDSSQVAIVIMCMMYQKYGDCEGDLRNEWAGTPTALYGEFKNIVETEKWNLNIDTKDKYWPKRANSLIRRLNEIKPTLKEKGLEISFYKENDRNRTKMIKIRKISSEPSEPSANQKSCSKID
jgi:Bifunctional DNA primase/polymerase, N-terminal